MTGQRPTILVTGSSGLIGSAVVARLVRNFTVVGLDIKPPRKLPAGAEHVTFDITSTDSLREGLRHIRERHGDRIASVIHLAAYYDFSGQPSDLYDRITVHGTERFLHALRESFRVEQFIFSSTMLVHAPGEPGHPLDEEDPLAPTWDYPESKVRTEKLLLRDHGDVPVVLLRIAGVYDDHGHSIPLAHQIQRIREQWLTSYVYPGDASRGQAFLHLEDLLDALERLVRQRQDLPPETTLLLGEPRTLGYGELQHQLGELIHGQPWPTFPVPAPVARAGAWLQDNLPLLEEPFIKPWMIDRTNDHYELDIGRARRLLGWEPRHSLAETLPRIVQALKADPEGWYRENRLQGKPSEANADVLTRLLVGSLAGLAATVPMTLVMEVLHRALPPQERGPLPPRLVTTRAVQAAAGAGALDESTQQNLAWTGHFGYGAVMGALYAALAPHLPLSPALRGTAWGLAVWTGSYLGWLPAVGLFSAREETPRRNGVMLGAHLVWGGALGLLMGHLLNGSREREASHARS